MRTLGTSGPSVGPVGLGCMGMSWAYGASERDDAQSVQVLRRALDLGVTLIDTADVYGPFTNEDLVGRGLEGRRAEAFLATKVGLVVGPDGITRDGRPEQVRAGIDASLQRLRTDHVDLYQLQPQRLGRLAHKLDVRNRVGLGGVVDGAPLFFVVLFTLFASTCFLAPMLLISFVAADV